MTSINRDDLETGRIDFADIDSGERIPAPTPGDMLRAEFMEPHHLSARRLAAELGVPTNRVTGILNGTRGISAETAILLGRRFGNSARFWLNLQMETDLAAAARVMRAA